MKIRVLVFSAGENSSVEFRNALANCVNIELFGASSKDRHGSYIFKNYIGNIPLIGEENFISEFNRVLEENKIDCVIPNHDSIALYLAEHACEIKAKIVGSCYSTNLICRDKKKIYDLFYDCEFCPVVYDDIEQYPSFIKPRESQGAVGAKLISDITEIPKDFNKHDFVITEYLPGQELTVDCLSDKNGNLVVAMPRTRERILAGIAVRSRSVVLTEELRRIAEEINSRLELRGVWNFQVKQDINGKYKLMEVAARGATSMGLSRCRDVNILLLSVYVTMGYDIDVTPNEYEIIADRAIYSRYKISYNFDRVYIDLDDTITKGDKVILPVIRLLYQFHNDNKEIILITKHETDHDDTVLECLSNHCISERIFNEIIILNDNQDKADMIDPRGAIFIDNAYKERKAVANKHNIPVFDVDTLDCLLDDTM